MSSSIYQVQLINAMREMKSSANGGNKILSDAIINNLTSWLSCCVIMTQDTGSYSGAYVYTGVGKNTSFTINNTSSLLANDLDNLSDKTNNLEIATKIINRVKQAVEQGQVVVSTNGTAVLPMSSPIPVVMYPSSSSTILTTMSPVAIIQLANNFNSMTKNNNDINVAQYITQAVKTVLQSIQITVVYTGLLNGVGKSTSVVII